MLKINRISLQNFRSFEEGEFCPEPNGTTALWGVSGAGKSSFLTALLWGLFGIRPSGVTQKDLKTRGVKGDTVVDVILDTTNGTVRVRRVLEEKGGTSLDVWANGNKVNAVGVKNGTSLISKLLGMTPDELRTNSVIEQGKIESLSGKSPAARASAVEEIVGLDVLINALTTAREKTREAKAIAEKFGTFTEDLSKAELEQTKEDLAHELETYQSYPKPNLGEVREKLDKLRKEQTELVANQSAYQQFLTQLQEWEGKIRLIEGDPQEKLNTLKAEGQDLKAQFEQAKDVYSRNQTELDQLVSKVKTLKETMGACPVMPEKPQGDKDELEKALQELSLEKDSLTSKFAEQQSVISALGTTPQTEKPSTLDTKAVQKELDETRTALSQLQKLFGEKTQVVKSFETDLENLQSLGETCPTCGQKVSQTWLKDFTKTTKDNLEKAKRELEDNEKQTSELTQKVEELENTLQTIEDFKNWEKLSKAKGEAEKLNSKREQVEANLVTAQTQLETLKNYEVQQDNYKEAIKRYDSIGEEILSLEKSQPTKERGAKLAKESMQSLQEKLDTARTLWNTYSKELETLNSKPQTTLENKEFALQTVSVAIKQAEGEELAQVRAMGEYQEIQEDIAELKSKISEIDRSLDSFTQAEKALEEVGVKMDAENLVSTYREETLTGLIPHMEAYMSEFVSTVTNGEVTEVTLDAKFTPSVKAGNKKKSYAMLSGGEKDVLGLAMRLSLANDNEDGFLWCDEVGASQDEERRGMLMRALGVLGSNRQVILVSHNSKDLDTCDKVYEVTKSDEGISQIS